MLYSKKVTTRLQMSTVCVVILLIFSQLPHLHENTSDGNFKKSKVNYIMCSGNSD